jgi:GTPase SAR1 family protein
VDETKPRVVICNKVDLEKKCSSVNIKQFSKEYKVEVFESSAKTGLNVNEPFMYLIKEVMKVKKQKEKKIIQEQPFQNEKSCKC